MRVTLNLTHACNLSCTYCYAGRQVKEDMSFETACRIVDWAMKIAPRGERVNLEFFGGEPLLRFDLMKDIIRYAREKERQGTRPVLLSVTSNGTLLNRARLDFFREQGIGLCVSIDGPAEIQDSNRCYRNGRGSFDDVIGNLRLAVECLERLQVNAVYGPGTVESLPETVTFFAELGVSSIHLNPNVSARWDDNRSRKVSESFERIAEDYVRYYENGIEIGVNVIDSKVILLLKGGYDKADGCPVGDRTWSFAPSGNIYPCARLVGEDENSFCIGSIQAGLDRKRIGLLRRQSENSNEECKTCELRRYCMNWCSCTNYYMTGRTDRSAPILCELEKAAVTAARHVLVALEDNELFLTHFIKYLHQRPQ